MDTQKVRFFLIFVMFALGMLLFDKWNQKVESANPPKNYQQTDMPALAAPATLNKNSIEQDTSVAVETDVFGLKVDLQGVDFIDAQLKQYPVSLNEPTPFALLSRNDKRYYVVQSGLLSDAGPDSQARGRARWSTEKTSYRLAPAANTLEVPFTWRNGEGLSVEKQLVFTRGSYVVKVNYHIKNEMNTPWRGRFYGQIKRDKSESSGMLASTATYTGAAFYQADEPYTKLSFSDMSKKDLAKEEKGGWMAMLEHYFLTAWIPNSEQTHTYYSRVDENLYAVGFLNPEIEVLPHQEKKVSATLYMGPEVTEVLGSLAPGLELTVDYGIFWPIAQPIFWVLKSVHHYVNNWGLAIIFVTLFIKVLFFKLSASSYRSMAKMRKIQPEMLRLKEQYGEDKQRLSQAIIELYKKEKVNPLGGCLPILVQIPVFIALYYVLLESVELRQAPFFGWIQDLSVKDPYFILPICMGISMFVQQKLSPAPSDPTQAKVMMMMPIVFTVLFFNFPAGLVLYWVVNNILSIAQQWMITKKIGA